MKTDLITKGAAVKAVLNWMDEHKREVIHKQDITDVIMPLSESIIRCKDCKHAFINSHHEAKPLICGYTRMCGTTEPNWFCADGERKENG